MQNKDTIIWPTKAGYGTASIGLGAVELMLQVYLLELYILAGLNPSLAGIAIAVAVFWDASKRSSNGDHLGQDFHRLTARSSVYPICSWEQSFLVLACFLFFSWKQ